MKNLFRLINLFFLFFSFIICAQSTDANDQIDSFKPFAKGNFIFGVGTNFNTEVSKNEDRDINFIIDEQDKQFNIKIGLGYVIADDHPIVLGFRYFSDKLNSIYENVIGDTISANSLEREFIVNLGYGINKPIFNSKKVYITSDPSIFFGIRKNESDRTANDIFELTESRRYSVSAGLNVGLLVFISPKMSVQATIGPIGAGYEWEDFKVDGEPDGSTSDLFIRMSPDLLNLEVSISRYF